MNASTTKTHEQMWCCEFTEQASHLNSQQFQAVLPGDSSLSDLKIMEILKTHGIDHTKTSPAEALSQLVKAISVDNKSLDMIIPDNLQDIGRALRQGFAPGVLTQFGALPGVGGYPKTNVMMYNMQRLLADNRITQEQFNQYLEQEQNLHAQHDGEATISEEKWSELIKKLGLEPLPVGEKE